MEKWLKGSWKINRGAAIGVVSGALLLIGFFAIGISATNAAPVVHVTSVQPDMTIGGDEAVVEGDVTPSNARVTLRGKPVQLSFSGHFRIRAKIQPGNNDLTFTAVSSNGKTSTFTAHVTRNATSTPNPTPSPSPTPTPTPTPPPPAPAAAAPPAAPAEQAPSVDDHNGATAMCNDGSYSYSANHRGTCSHHGGVAQWYK